MGDASGSAQERLAQELRAGEQRRLRHGIDPGERAPAGTLFALDVVSEPGDAGGVAQRVRDALVAVISGAEEEIDTDGWDDRLPDWLMERFVPESEASTEGWGLHRWVQWFGPRWFREWFWWDAVEIDRQQLRVLVVTIDLPFAHDALRFLLEAAGADHIGDPTGLRS